MWPTKVSVSVPCALSVPEFEKRPAGTATISASRTGGIWSRQVQAQFDLWSQALAPRRVLVARHLGDCATGVPLRGLSHAAMRGGS